MFGNSLYNEYAYDGEMLINNMKGKEWAALSALISPDEYSGVTTILSWRPLTAFLYMAVDDHLFGTRPALSHALNLLFHALNGWLLFLLIRSFAGFKEGDYEFAALPASLLFLVHPLVTETVLCVGFRGDLSALTFVLLSLNCIVKWMATRKNGYLAGAISLFAIALLFKEIAVVVLPMAPLLVLTQFWDAKRSRSLGVFGSFLLIFIVWFLIWRLFRYDMVGFDYLGSEGRLLGIANFIVASCEIYLNKLLIPFPMRIDHAFDPITTLGDLRLWLSLSILTVAAAVPVLLTRCAPTVLLGIAWIAAAFLPVSQIIVVPDPIAERFCYVPMGGIAFIFAGLTETGLRRELFSRRTLLLLSLPFIVLLGGLSFLRTFDWRNDLELNIANWEAATPNSEIAMESLGALYLSRSRVLAEQGNPTSAAEDMALSFEQLQSLVEQYPNNAQGHRLAAVWYLINNQQPAAQDSIKRALELDPTDPLIRQTGAALGVSPPPP